MFLLAITVIAGTGLITQVSYALQDPAAAFQGDQAQTAMASPAPNGTAAEDVDVHYWFPSNNMSANYPDTKTPVLAKLPKGTKVTISCWYPGEVVTGAAATGPSSGGGPATDPYWDRLSDHTNGLPPGSIAVVADAKIQTSSAIDKLVKPCTGYDATTMHKQAGVPGPAGSQNVAILKAQQIVAGSGYERFGDNCFLGVATVDCTIPDTIVPGVVFDTPARYTDMVVQHAAQAGVDPRLLLCILMNEGGEYHGQGEGGSTIGVGNMSQSTFTATQKAHNFSGTWLESEVRPDVSITAAAWYLHDLAHGGGAAGKALPATWPAKYSRDELLAVGYNAGDATMNQIAGGAKPGTQATWYINHINQYWPTSDRAICKSGMFSCNL